MITKKNNKSALRSTKTLIISIGLILGMIFAAFSVYLAYEHMENTKRQRLDYLKQTVQIARNSIEPILVRYRSQEISISDALEQVRNLVRNMTYTDHVGKNYIFMSAYDGIVLVQPFEPEKEMTDMWDLKDFNGLYIIRALVKVAKSKDGYGYVSYFYKRPDKTEPEEKVSFVLGIPDLGCYIATGQYMADIRKDQRIYLAYIVMLTSILLILLFILVRGAMKVISKQNSILHRENKALKVAEKELDNAGKFLETIINHIPSQIFWKNKNLNYIGCNRSFSNVIGLDNPQSIAGLTDFDFNRDSAHAESYRKWDKQIIESKKAVIDLEENYHDSNGNEGTVLTSKVPVYDVEGDCICILVACTDIT